MADGSIAEKFNYENVSARMNEIITTRNKARSVMDSITDILSTAITNTESADRALGGNTAAIWKQWNDFYESFSQFGASMDRMYTNVKESSANNTNFESGNAATITSAVNSSQNG